MISVQEAQAIVRAQCARLDAESVALRDGVGRVLARTLASPVDLPPFDNSAMDGFALRSAGTVLASGAEFIVQGEQAAGDSIVAADGHGAWEIMTGARVPDGLDAVVPVEQVEVLARNQAQRPTRIRLLAGVPPGQHVRRAGEDIAQGEAALLVGSWLTPAHALLAAGLGFATLDVVRRPRVAVLCTGRELVDDPALPLQPGQIRNSNGTFLALRLAAAGAEVVWQETVPDETEVFLAAVQRALQAGAELVLSTGAVSMGRYDFVPPALRRIGAEILFHKLAMRPGKPLLFARLREGPLYFGLPGNPVSAAVGLRFFVEAALRVQLGLPQERGWRLPLAHEVHKKVGFRWQQKARLQLSRDGHWSVGLLRGQESFRTQPLLAANAWVSLPETAESLPSGASVEVYALGHEMNLLWGEQSE
jgi:molybdopterin molybdotransferase